MVSAAGGNAHTGPPTEAPSRRKKKKSLSFQARLSLKPALPQLFAYAKSTTESKRGEKREWEPASAERRGGGENRKRGEQRKGGKQREGELEWE